MKCPYCAEKIKDEAIVCRYCKRDLVTILPFVNRLDAIDSKITEIKNEVGNLQQILIKREPKRDLKTGNKQPASFYILALLLGGIISVAFYSIYTWIPSTRPFALWISIIIPLFVGCWIGLISSPENFLSYVSIGIGAGIINSIGVIINLSFYLKQITGKIDYFKVITLYFLTPFFLIILGCLIGDWITTKREGRSGPPTYARNVARAFVKTSPVSPEDDERRIEHFAKLMSSLTPLLTFLASIISAYFTFQAAIHK